jgi:nicotinate-nucleotide adenylyltransferase
MHRPLRRTHRTRQPSSRIPMTLLLFYGGTFDPVHNGHLAIAAAAGATLGVDVRLMPAADPPHRSAPGATAAQRAEMLDLAVRDRVGLRVDRRELARTTRSYTIDTLRELRGEFGHDVPIAFLIGADSLLGLPTWKEWRALLDGAHFVVAERPGSAIHAAIEGGIDPMLADAVAGRWAADATALHSAPGGRLLRLHQPLHGASASEIRRRIVAAEPWRDQLPAAVADYIERQGLYRPVTPPAL